MFAKWHVGDAWRHRVWWAEKRKSALYKLPTAETENTLTHTHTGCQLWYGDKIVSHTELFLPVGTSILKHNMFISQSLHK